MRIWLNELTGNEHGWMAWSLDYMGFATWAPSREDVLTRAPSKLEEYRLWLARHGLTSPPAPTTEPTILEEISGNEVVFEHDRQAADPSEIELCLELIARSRRNLTETVKDLPDELLDWDPPYRDFATWARWRTIRQILEHVALTEIGYYLPSIGYAGTDPDHLRSLPWREQLRLSRAETDAFLKRLAADRDRLRLSEGEEAWSVRKVLRRLVWHELVHLKSIRRIVAEHR